MHATWDQHEQLQCAVDAADLKATSYANRPMWSKAYQSKL